MYFLNNKKSQKLATIISEFPPVILFLFYLIYPNQFFQFANSVLGKFVFLVLVIIYTMIDKLVGTFFALIFIVYYQSELLENFDALNNYPEYMQSIAGDPKYQIISSSHGSTKKENAAAAPEQRITENFSGGLDDGAQKFVRENCRNGKLTTNANPDSFSLGYGPDGKCNPCDKNCWFYMLESKLSTEEKVLFPKNSNTWYERIINTLTTGEGGTGIGTGRDGFVSGNGGSGLSPTSTPGVISEAFSQFAAAQ
jgi:hypothetical protein